MAHRHAKPAPLGRLLPIESVVDMCWPVNQAAALSVSRRPPTSGSGAGSRRGWKALTIALNGSQPAMHYAPGEGRGDSGVFGCACAGGRIDPYGRGQPADSVLSVGSPLVRGRSHSVRPLLQPRGPVVPVVENLFVAGLLACAHAINIGCLSAVLRPGARGRDVDARSATVEPAAEA